MPDKARAFDERRAVKLSPHVSNLELLLWDSVGVVGLESKLSDLYDANPFACASAQYLVEWGVVDPLPGNADELSRYASELGVSLSRSRATTSLRVRVPIESSPDSRTFRIRLPDSRPALGDGYEQVLAEIERRAGWNSTPIVSVRGLPSDEPTLRHYGPFVDAVRERNVAEIVLRALPVPATDTPIEKMLDFRSDARTRELFDRLRLWMIDAASGDAPAGKLEAELRTQLADYKAHMRRERIKQGATPLRALLTAVAGFLEGVSRVKLVKATDSLFAVQERRVNLLAAEQSAPGRELAYIAEAEREFGSA